MERRRLVLLSGAGTSIAFGFPPDLTTEINRRVEADPMLRELHGNGASTLLAFLLRALREDVGLRTVTFEHLYEALDHIGELSEPLGEHALDEFRPVVRATHELRAELRELPQHLVRNVHETYHDAILHTVLERDESVQAPLLRPALDRLRADHAVWSFTLNYDGLIRRALPSAVTGFTGAAPRPFDFRILPAVIRDRGDVHAHVHGALSWGQPRRPAHRQAGLDPFQVHEFESSREGVENSAVMHGGQKTQSGSSRTSGTIITGLSKNDAVAHEPYTDLVEALKLALEDCTDLVIAGYSFSDLHVNRAIRRFRWRRGGTRTYVVDYNTHNHPHEFLSILRQGARWTLGGEQDVGAFRKIGGSDWWWARAQTGRVSTEGVAYWLRGFDTFCEAVTTSGLPQV